MSKQLKADLFILGVMVFWGFSFILTDFSAIILGTYTLNAWRFLVAFFVAVLLSYKKLKNISGLTFRYSILQGFMLALTFASITYGVQYTTLSNAGFLCGLTVIFTPLLSSLIYRTWPGIKFSIIALICASGIACLTLTEQFTIDHDNLKGDLFCVLCSFLYAIYLLINEKAVSKKEVNAFQLGVLQLAACGFFNLAAAFIAEKPTIPASWQVWGAILFLAVLCTALAFTVLTVAQQYTSASHVGVINCFETVFAGFVAYTIGQEVLTMQSAIGALLIIGALFAMEINLYAVGSCVMSRYGILRKDK